MCIGIETGRRQAFTLLQPQLPPHVQRGSSCEASPAAAGTVSSTCNRTLRPSVRTFSLRVTPVQLNGTSLLNKDNEMAAEEGVARVCDRIAEAHIEPQLPFPSASPRSSRVPPLCSHSSACAEPLVAQSTNPGCPLSPLPLGASFSLPVTVPCAPAPPPPPPATAPPRAPVAGPGASTLDLSTSPHRLFGSTHSLPPALAAPTRPRELVPGGEAFATGAPVHTAQRSPSLASASSASASASASASTGGGGSVCGRGARARSILERCESRAKSTMHIILTLHPLGWQPSRRRRVALSECAIPSASPPPPPPPPPLPLPLPCASRERECECAR